MRLQHAQRVNAFIVCFFQSLMFRRDKVLQNKSNSDRFNLINALQRGRTSKAALTALQQIIIAVRVALKVLVVDLLQFLFHVGTVVLLLGLLLLALTTV